MKVEVDMYKNIRQSYCDGESQRSIAKRLGISRQPVKKYCEGSAYPEVRKSYQRKNEIVTDDVKQFILGCFQEDEQEGLKKQKHTAKRIFDRLVTEQGFTGGESTIRREVKGLRAEQLVPPQCNVPLSYEPGEAIQIDWGVKPLFI